MLIIEQLAKCLADIGGIAKSRKTKGSGDYAYNFRGIDDFLNAVQPLFAKHQVICVPEVIKDVHEERETAKGGTINYAYLTVKFTFYASDGSKITATTIGEAMDSSDKASNKAMSAALKYCLINTLCIGTEEAKDSEDDHHEVKPRSNKPAFDRPKTIVEGVEPEESKPVAPKKAGLPQYKQWEDKRNISEDDLKALKIISANNNCALPIAACRNQAEYLDLFTKTCFTNNQGNVLKANFSDFADLVVANIKAGSDPFEIAGNFIADVPPGECLATHLAKNFAI